MGHQCGEDIGKKTAAKEMDTLDSLSKAKKLIPIEKRPKSLLNNVEIRLEAKKVVIYPYLNANSRPQA